MRRIARRMLDDERAAALADATTTERVPTLADRRRDERHAPRWRHYEELERLHVGGASIIAVSCTLGMNRKTIRRWLHRGGPPLWKKPERATVIDPYRAFLERRWQEGCRNAAELARELERGGAEVSPRAVRDWAMRRRKAGADHLDAGPQHPRRSWRPPSVRRTARLLQTEMQAVSDRDRTFLHQLGQDAPDLVTTAGLVRRLSAILRKQSDERIPSRPILDPCSISRE